MQNPWSLIQTQFFNIHPDDEGLVTQYNKKAKPPFLVERSLPPLPYIGNPLSARVLLLGKNPSYNTKDEEDYENYPSLEAENHKALTFESKCPFFYLAPEFERTTGSEWWWNVLEDILTSCQQRGVELDTLLSRIACVQWHPYRSVSAFVPDPPFPTQAYGHYLVRQAVATTNPLFVMQYGIANERNWRTMVPELPQDLIKTKSAQNAKISRGNLRAGDFDRLIVTLCAPDIIETQEAAPESAA